MPDTQTEILTVTLNPTVDLTTRTAHVSAGPKLRCATPLAEPGGGGINVSRAIRQLGGRSLAFLATGGDTGARLLRLLAAEGVRFTAFSVGGDTRQSLTVGDDETGAQYRFVMPGPRWDAALEDEALRGIVAASAPDGLVVLSGSQPPNVAADFPARLCAALAPRDTRLFVDTSGPALDHLARGVHPPPAILRMDEAEAEALAGRPLPKRADTTAFARELRAAGAARMVIIARGADGSTLVTAEGSWHCERRVDPAQVVSAVGAGDSFAGAFALALARGATPQDALRHGTAAAAAALLTDGTQLCTQDDTDAMLPGCALTAL